ncbi:Reeler domain-containing protein [Idiomarina xiamenensis]|uniref:Reelin domain-containing protein n=1 Tax=Idiomarina xiamenensis 10-D-4 TaxID=740709 RepID=K2K1Q8_9GAMM|nr:Reeler domain-containing protein [Idiomarina xiamenensis]EKE80622.1 hypothetical protein A10D4_11706 [Idiomarina xiamenensis 10-D-4]
MSRFLLIWLLLVAAVSRSALALQAVSEALPIDHGSQAEQRLCGQCHVPATIQRAEQTGIQIEGLPTQYEPGKRYQLTLVLHDKSRDIAGFQLYSEAISEEPIAGLKTRLPSAGQLASVSDDTQLMTTDNGESYLTHSRLTLKNETTASEIRWSFTWHAPNSPDEKVRFTAMAVASSTQPQGIGDQVYRFERIVFTAP